MVCVRIYLCRFPGIEDCLLRVLLVKALLSIYEEKVYLTYLLLSMVICNEDALSLASHLLIAVIVGEPRGSRQSSSFTFDIAANENNRGSLLER